MATLYIRDVPEFVVATLKERASHAGQSLSAYAASELSRLSARSDNAEIAARLAKVDRSQGPISAEIFAEIRSGRR